MGSRISEKSLFPGLFIMIGLIFLGIFIKSAIVSFKSYDRVVVVKGLAELEVPANKVIWPVVYKEIGNDLTQLYKIINDKNTLIINHLLSQGVDSSEIRINAPVIIDMNAERYQSQPSAYRYNITSIITVTSENVELVSEIISGQSKLLSIGIALVAGDYEYQTQYFYTGLNSIKPSMIEEATMNARAAAEKFADDSNSKLGKIKRASQGQFIITDRDANTPQIKTVRVVSTIEYMLRD